MVRVAVEDYLILWFQSLQQFVSLFLVAVCPNKSLHEDMQTLKCGGGGLIKSFFSSPLVHLMQQQIQLSSSCVPSDILVASSLIQLHLPLQLQFQHASVPHSHLWACISIKVKVKLEVKLV